MFYVFCDGDVVLGAQKTQNNFFYVYWSTFSKNMGVKMGFNRCFGSQNGSQNPHLGVKRESKLWFRESNGSQNHILGVKRESKKSIRL